MISKPDEAQVAIAPRLGITTSSSPIDGPTPERRSEARANALTWQENAENRNGLSSLRSRSLSSSKPMFR